MYIALYWLLFVVHKFKWFQDTGIAVIKFVWRTLLTSVAKFFYIGPVVISTFILFLITAVIGIGIDVTLIIFVKDYDEGTTVKIVKAYLKRVSVLNSDDFERLANGMGRKQKRD